MLQRTRGAAPLVRKIAIANQKGGVGKTTTAINLAASLTVVGSRTLVIDMDPQGNATTSSGIDKNEVENTSADLLLGKKTLAECAMNAAAGNYAVVPANETLIAAEMELHDVENRELCLKKALSGMLDEYRFVLFDSPPTLNLLTVNVLAAADEVLAPIQCEFFALEGISALLESIREIRARVNSELRLTGALRTMFDPRNNLALDVSRQLEAYFGDDLLRSIIPRNVTLAEAPSHGMPALCYDSKARGSQAYMMLAGEILSREAARRRL